LCAGILSRDETRDACFRDRDIAYFVRDKTEMRRFGSEIETEILQMKWSEMPRPFWDEMRPEMHTSETIR